MIFLYEFIYDRKEKAKVKMASKKYLAVLETDIKDNIGKNNYQSKVVLFSHTDRVEIEKMAQTFIKCKVEYSEFKVTSEDSFDGYRFELHDTYDGQNKMVKHRLYIVDEHLSDIKP